MKRRQRKQPKAAFLLANEALGLLQKSGQSTPPFNPWLVAKEMAIPVEERQLDGVEGFVQLVSGEAKIVLNSDAPAVRKRFTLAHELGHAVLMTKRKGGTPVDLVRYRFGIPQNGAFSDPLEERLCNMFASLLLMPDVACLDYWKTQSATPSAVHRFAERFHVSLQTELRDARAAFETAKLLYDAMLTSNSSPSVSADSVNANLTALRNELGLDPAKSVEAVIKHIEEAQEGLNRHLRVLQSVLSRTRELGQNETEFNQLTEQLERAREAQRTLDTERALSTAATEEISGRLAKAANTREALLDAVAVHERYQQATVMISALESRLLEAKDSERRVREDVDAVRRDLVGAVATLNSASDRVARISQAFESTSRKRSVIQRVTDGLSSLPTAGESHSSDELDSRRHQLAEEIAETERALEACVRDVAEATARGDDRRSKELLSAINQLRSGVDDGKCPLCGHDHGQRSMLIAAIDAVAAQMSGAAASLRSRLEELMSKRRDLEAKRTTLQSELAGVDSQLREILIAQADIALTRTTALSQMQRDLRSAGIEGPVTLESLIRTGAALNGDAVQQASEQSEALDAQRDAEGARSAMERTLAAKVAEAEQLTRLIADLQTQIERTRLLATVPTDLSDMNAAKQALATTDSLIGDLELAAGRARAALSELERLASDNAATVGGLQRRLDVVSSFLNSVDAELREIGATREIRTVLDLEQHARSEIARFGLAKTTADRIQQQLRSLQEGRALVQARANVETAETNLKSLQDSQARMQQRAQEFNSLHQRLENLQNATAETVLESIRPSVKIVFQAMTAGCPWDIEFKLDGGEVRAMLTDGDSTDVIATSVLNSAYLNVAAIALRLALASQQRWTRLRTVVLDDPILEMDHLTQSALIDGLEAVLCSDVAPWKDLQLVITTWSEDFAVMAAHKLAHLNGRAVDNGLVAVDEEFLIHRLFADPDGRNLYRATCPQMEGRSECRLRVDDPWPQHVGRRFYWNVSVGFELMCYELNPIRQGCLSGPAGLGARSRLACDVEARRSTTRAEKELFRDA